MPEPIYGTNDFILKKLLSAVTDIKDMLMNKGPSILQFSKETIQIRLLQQINFLNLYKLPNKIALEDSLPISNGYR